MLAFRRFVVTAALFAAAQVAAWGLSIDEVIELSKSAVSDEVIVSQIDASGTVFVLSANELIRLKENGVSERVMLHMIRTRTAASRQEAPLTGALRDRIQQRQEREDDGGQSQAPSYVPPAPATVIVPATTTYVVEQPVATPVYYYAAPRPVYVPRYYYAPTYYYPTHCGTPAYYYPSHHYYSYPRTSFGFSYGRHGHHSRWGFGLSFGF